MYIVGYQMVKWGVFTLYTLQATHSALNHVGSPTTKEKTMWLPITLFFLASIFLWLMNGLDELKKIEHENLKRRMLS